MKLKRFERRIAATELRAIDDPNVKEPKIIGYAAVFNSPSEDFGGYREIIEPGAFTQTLTADVRALLNHDPNFVLGRTINKTLNLSEDETGLLTEIRPPSTTWAADLLTSIQRGDINQMSFGFRTLDEAWEKRNGEYFRVLKRVELFDVSPVTFPAYPETEVSVRVRPELVDVDKLETVLLFLEKGLELTPEQREFLRETVAVIQPPSEPEPVFEPVIEGEPIEPQRGISEGAKRRLNKRLALAEVE